MRARCRIPRPTRLVLRLRGQDGAMFVEVMVTAVVGIVIALAVYKGLDQASATYGNNRGKTDASGLADQDQERLRAMKPVDLSNRRETRTVTVGAVPYTVKSRGDWITDSSGTTSCTSGSARADYLKLTSTVTWPAMGKTKPAVAESIMAVPAGSFGNDRGNMAVQVTDRNAAGVEGINVSITGPASKSDQTNELGCAFFGYIPAGNYQVQLAEPGYVNKLGVNALNLPASVVAGSLAPVPVEYDLAGGIDAEFDTRIAGGPPVATQAQVLSAGNSGLTTPRLFGSVGSPQSSIDAINLFPFSSPYGLYSGNCVSAEPTQYGAPAHQVSVDPGGSYGPITVRQPAINVLVRRSGNPLQNARVTFTPNGAGCSVTKTARTNAQGQLADPSMPYGFYTIDVQCGSRSAQRNNVPNVSADGTPTIDMTIGSGAPCP